MRHYAGLDVSIKETSVCIIDESGKVCRQTKVPSHPEDLARALHDRAWCLERVGLEAGPLSQWLFSGLAVQGCRGFLSRRGLRNPSPRARATKANRKKHPATRR